MTVNDVIALCYFTEFGNFRDALRTSSSAIAERLCCKVGYLWPKVEDWNWETIFYGHRSIFTQWCHFWLRPHVLRPRPRTDNSRPRPRTFSNLGPPFRGSAIPEVRHERTKWRIGVWLDWINCYFLILYFVDFPPFLLLWPWSWSYDISLNLTSIRCRHTACPNTNFLRQGFPKSSSDIQGGSKKVSCWHSTTAYFLSHPVDTDRQTDTVHSLIKIYSHEKELTNKTVFTFYWDTVYNNNTPEWRTPGMAGRYPFSTAEGQANAKARHVQGQAMAKATLLRPN